jgi:hypothetical protein
MLVVEGAGVLARVVTGKVAGGLGCPGSGGVGGDAGEVYTSGVDFDEEQDVESAQGDGVDTEEVCGDDGVGLGEDELVVTGKWRVGVDQDRCLWGPEMVSCLFRRHVGTR